MLLGLVVGTILGLTGAGGAILSVPLLGFFLHLSVAQAAPIGLTAVTLSAGIGAVLGLRARVLRYKAALLIAGTGLILSPIGIWLAHQLPNSLLVIVFTVVLLWVSRNMWLQAKREQAGLQDPIGPPCQLDQRVGRFIWNLPCARALMASGALAGFFSGMLGVGGGFIIVPSLKRFTDLPLHSVVATSLGVLTLVSLGGVVFSNFYGSMDWSLALPFSLGSVSGLLLGRTLGKYLPETLVQQGFSIFASIVGIAMLGQLFR